MKKILTGIAALVFALTLAFAFVGCNSPTSSGASASSSSNASLSASARASDSSSSKSFASTSVSTSKKNASSSYASSTSSSVSEDSDPGSAPLIKESGEYSDKDSVAFYIHTYGHLPSNYISKTKARKAGWDSTKGNLWDVLPGMSIGGSEFYNDDGQLPDANGRRWTECDIDYSGGFRNAKRIVFSNDGLIYYTDDHYKTFERLY